MRRTSAYVGLLLALLVTALLLSGCSKGGSTAGTGTSTAGTSTVTTAPASSNASSTANASTTATATAQTGITLVDGGKTRADYEKEIPELEAKLKTSPEDLTLLQDLAVAQYQTKDYAGASQTYEKMLSLKNDATYRNNYGNVLRDWKKLAEAEAQYRQAIQIDPTLVTPYINLVGVLLSQQKTADAMALLDQGIAKTTGDDKARLEKYKAQLEKAKK